MPLTLLDVLDGDELGATIDQQILGHEGGVSEDGLEPWNGELTNSESEPVSGDIGHGKAVDDGPHRDDDLDLYLELI